MTLSLTGEAGVVAVLWSIAFAVLYWHAHLQLAAGERVREEMLLRHDRARFDRAVDRLLALSSVSYRDTDTRFNLQPDAVTPWQQARNIGPATAKPSPTPAWPVRKRRPA